MAQKVVAFARDPETHARLREDASLVRELAGARPGSG